jgi:hypothetical protein
MEVKIPVCSFYGKRDISLKELAESRSLPDARSFPLQVVSEPTFPLRPQKKAEGQGTLFDDGRSPFADKGKKGQDEHTESDDEETQ